MKQQNTWLRRSKANAEKNRRSPSGQEDRNTERQALLVLSDNGDDQPKLSILRKKRLLCIEIYSSRYVKLTKYIEEVECTKHQEMNPATTFIIVQRQQDVSDATMQSRTMQSRRSTKSCNNHKYTRIKSRKKWRHCQNSEVVFYSLISQAAVRNCRDVRAHKNQKRRTVSMTSCGS